MHTQIIIQFSIIFTETCQQRYFYRLKINNFLFSIFKLSFLRLSSRQLYVYVLNNILQNYLEVKLHFFSKYAEENNKKKIFQ